MMKIIAHRGMWLKPEEKNTISAFERALQNGFGIETDFRDLNGELVISHDPAGPGSMKAQSFFELCSHYPSVDPHAINIKSDGLQRLLNPYLAKWRIQDYFVFDMSVPDSLGYIKSKINIFTRVSEYEAYQDFDNHATGIWLDAFKSEWYSEWVIKDFSLLGKRIAIVSPELHGREHKALWGMLKSLCALDINMMLCTDLPLEAKRYFYDQN